MRWITIFAILGILTVSCRGHRLRQDADPMLRKLDHRVKYLKLTPDQEVRYQSIRERLKADIEAHQTARNGVVRQMKVEFQKEDPDVKSQTDAIKRAMQDRQTAFLRLPDYYAEFYSILDAEQKARLNEKVRKRLNRLRLPEE